jgi:hypothetical protein
VQGTLLLIGIVVLLSVSVAVPFLQGGASEKVDQSEDEAATIETSGLTPDASFNYTRPVYANAPVTLNASESDLRGGDSATYEWDLDDDGEYEKRGEVITHTFTTTGVTSVELRVQRDDVTALPDTVTNSITVEQAPAPEAQFTHSSPIYVDEDVTLDASNSDIGDSADVSYDWDLDGDGAYEKSGETITHVFDETGDQSVELRVTKNDIPADPDNTTQTLTVQDDPAPIASFTVDGPLTAGAQFDVNASSSTDPHGTITAYEWDFDGDGEAEDTGEVADHRYDSAGIKEVTLTLTEVDGQTNTTTREIDIEDANGANQKNRFWGDPHMTTLDGKKYDFMGIGEFVLTRDEDGDGPRVQIRTDQYAYWGASVTTAVALEVDGHTVVIDFEEGGRGNAPDQLRIDGESRTISENGQSIAVGNGAVFRTRNSYTVIYPGANDRVDDSDTAFRFTERYSRGDVYVDMDMHLNESSVTEMEGLIGNADGDRSNDIQTADGEILSTSYQDLYGKLDASWRLTTESESLFDHDDGRSLEDINRETFPSSQVVSMNDLGKQTRVKGKELAREHCLEPGTKQFENAVIDWGVTADKSIFDRLAPEDCQSG